MKLPYRIARVMAGGGLATVLLLATGCQDAGRPDASAAKNHPPAPIYEPFDYSVERQLIGATGGRGFGLGWSSGGFNARTNLNFRVATNSLVYPGLATAGGRVTTVEQTVIAGLERPLGYLIGVDGTTRYLGFLVRPEGTLHGGAFNGFFGLSLMSAAELLPYRDPGGTFGSRLRSPRGLELFVSKPGGGATNEWVLEDRGGNNQVASGKQIRLGETFLIVVRMDFAVRGDTFTIHVNPVVGGPEPTNGAAKTDTRMGLVDRVVLYSTGACSIDEIRIGDTFESVTPSK
jgi:hypothetical protein